MYTKKNIPKFGILNYIKKNYLLQLKKKSLNYHSICLFSEQYSRLYFDIVILTSFIHKYILVLKTLLYGCFLLKRRISLTMIEQDFARRMQLMSIKGEIFVLGV